MTDAVDPALAGRELGPWFMVPAWVSVPIAACGAALLVWYFIRLGGPGVPASRRWLRRAGIVFALVGIGPLLRALTFVHPHEDRVAWATAWSFALLALVGWFALALVDIVLVLRGGLHDYGELRREVFGGGRDKSSGASGAPGAVDRSGDGV